MEEDLQAMFHRLREEKCSERRGQVGFICMVLQSLYVAISICCDFFHFHYLWLTYLILPSFAWVFSLLHRPR